MSLEFVFFFLLNTGVFKFEKQLSVIIFLAAIWTVIVEFPGRAHSFLED